MNWFQISRELDEAGCVHCGYVHAEEWGAAIRLVEFQDERLLFYRGVISEQSRESLDRGRAKDRGHRRLSSSRILDSRDQAGRQQGVATDFEKVVVDPDSPESEHVLPDSDKQMLLGVERLAFAWRIRGDSFALYFFLVVADYGGNPRSYPRKTGLTVHQR